MCAARVGPPDSQPPLNGTKNVIQPATVVSQVDPVLSSLSSLKSNFSVRPHTASSILAATPSLKASSRETTASTQNRHQSALKISHYPIPTSRCPSNLAHRHMSPLTLHRRTESDVYTSARIRASNTPPVPRSLWFAGHTGR